MAHILVVGSNSTGPLLIDRLLACGHQVAFVEPCGPRAYGSSPDVEAILGRCGYRRTYTPDATGAYGDLLDILGADLRHQPVDAVICGDGPCVEHAAAVAARLGLPFSSPGAIAQAHDKLLFRQRLSSVGLPGPRFAPCSSLQEAKQRAGTEVAFPLVLKPRVGHSSSCCHLAHDVAELERAWQLFDEMVLETDLASRAALQRGRLIEEYLPGEMFSVEIASNGHWQLPLVVCSRVRAQQDEFADYRIDMPAPLDAAATQACRAHAVEVVQALGLGVGIFHVELMLTEHAGPLCIECNPRLMGGYMPPLFSTVFSINVYDLLASLHLDACRSMPHIEARTAHAASVRIEAASTAPATSTGVPPTGGIGDSEILFAQFDPSIQQGELIRAGQVLGRVQLSCQDQVTLDRAVNQLLCTASAFYGVDVLR